MACQAFRVYEMIILFRPYGTLMAYIMQHGGVAAYIMNARACVAYTMPMRYAGVHAGLGQNSLARFNLLTPAPLFLRLRIYYSPQILN